MSTTFTRIYAQPCACLYTCAGGRASSRFFFNSIIKSGVYSLSFQTEILFCLPHLPHTRVRACACVCVPVCTCVHESAYVCGCACVCTYYKCWFTTLFSLVAKIKSKPLSISHLLKEKEKMKNRIFIQTSLASSCVRWWLHFAKLEVVQIYYSLKWADVA